MHTLNYDKLVWPRLVKNNNKTKHIAGLFSSLPSVGLVFLKKSSFPPRVGGALLSIHQVVLIFILTRQAWIWIFPLPVNISIQEWSISEKEPMISLPYILTKPKTKHRTENDGLVSLVNLKCTCWMCQLSRLLCHISHGFMYYMAGNSKCQPRGKKSKILMLKRSLFLAWPLIIGVEGRKQKTVKSYFRMNICAQLTPFFSRRWGGCKIV